MLKNIVSISLALLILLVSVGLSASTHICGGEKVKTGLALGNMTYSCSPVAEIVEPPLRKVANAVYPIPCCSDSRILFDIENQRTVDQLQTIDESPISFLPGISKVQDLFERALDKTHFKFYFPPDRLQNFQVVFQVFRI